MIFNEGNDARISEIRHNHHPSGVKMLAKFIRRGIWILDGLLALHIYDIYDIICLITSRPCDMRKPNP
jgi:hypothetical protein